MYLVVIVVLCGILQICLTQNFCQIFQSDGN